MNPYASKATSLRYVYVDMELKPGGMYFSPVKIRFLYDSQDKSVKYCDDDLFHHQEIITDYQDEVNIDDMFTCGVAPYTILDSPCFHIFVKSGKRKRQIVFENSDDILEYYNSYKWVINLFRKICEEKHLIKL